MKHFYISFMVKYDENSDIVGLVFACPTDAPTMANVEELSEHLLVETKAYSVVCISCFPLHVEEAVGDDEKFYQREFALDKV